MTVKEMEFYELLEIECTADETMIKRSYKKLALKYHPDRNAGDPEAGEMFKKVGQAYEVLSDPEKRKTYDRHGKKGLEEGGGGGGSSADDIFSMFFGGGRRGGEPKPKDIVHELPVTLEEMYTGKSKKIAATRDRVCGACNGNGIKATAQLKSCTRCGGAGAVIGMREIFPGMVQRVQMRCDMCNGQGQSVRPEDICSDCRGAKVVKDRKVLDVHIERGARSRDHIRFAGEGDQVPGVRQIGDIIIFLNQKPHEVFQRIGDHLLFQHEISLHEALCGFEMPLEQLDRRMLLVKIPPGQVIDPSFAWYVNREGMPIAGTGATERGHLVINFRVKFPPALDNAAKGAIGTALEYTVPNITDKDVVQTKLTAAVQKPQPKRQPRSQQRASRGGGGPQSIPVQGCAQQ
jgi:DnaJ family protein A protein 2